MVVDLIQFDWDLGNRSKCGKHGVSVAVIEGLFAGPARIVPDPAHSILEDRLNAIGITADGRHVFVAFTRRSRNGTILIRPISARYMHAKEIAIYEAIPSDLQN